MILPKYMFGENSRNPASTPIPSKPLAGRISNVPFPSLDPTIRTAKVRIEVRDPGMMRVGRFRHCDASTEQKKEMQQCCSSLRHFCIYTIRDCVYIPDGRKEIPPR